MLDDFLAFPCASLRLWIREFRVRDVGDRRLGIENYHADNKLGLKSRGVHAFWFAADKCKLL